MKVLILGSSMSMPLDELNYNSTWVHRLFQILTKENKRPEPIEFIDRCRRASTSKRLVSEGMHNNGVDLLEFYEPDVVIMQLGITDCAPRVFKKNALTTKVINILPFKSLIYKLAKKYRGRSIKNADVSPDKFQEYIDTYVSRCAKIGCLAIIIKISEPHPNIYKKSPLLEGCIKRYNRIYDELSSKHKNIVLIEGENNNDIGIYQSDGIHLTEKGHEKILNKLIDSFKELNK